MSVAYSEQLYKLLPAVHQIRDSRHGEPLRALLKIIGEQVGHVHADIEHLYENWFIETCDDWVVPYIADLVGFRSIDDPGEPGDALASGIAELNRFLFPRREVGNTVRLRRRKGTLSVLEDLAFNVANWSGRAVEFAQQAFTTAHPRFQSCGMARMVDFHNPDQIARLGTAFNTLHHTADVRSPQSRPAVGWYHPQNVGLFVWRRKIHSITRGITTCVEVIPCGIPIRYYTFSPLGHDGRLMVKPQRETDPVGIAEDIHLPVPLTRWRLAQYKAPAGASATFYGPEKSLAIYHKNQLVTGDKILVCNLQSLDIDPIGVLLSIWKSIFRGAKANAERVTPLVQPAIDKRSSLQNHIFQFLENRIAVDPETGRMLLPRHMNYKHVRVSWHYSSTADMGSGEYPRQVVGSDVPVNRVRDANPETPALDLRKLIQPRHYPEGCGTAESEITEQKKPNDVLTIENSIGIEFANSVKWSINNFKRIVLKPGVTLLLRGAAGSRPLLEIAGNSEQCSDGLTIEMGEGSKLILDGLLICGDALHIRQWKLDGPDTPDPYKSNTGHEAGCNGCPHEDAADFESGRFRRIVIPEVIIHHCTLVRAGNSGSSCDDCSDHPVSLRTRLPAGRVKIDHSITGAIRIDDPDCGQCGEAGVETEPCPERHVELCITDSIIDGCHSGSALRSDCCRHAHADASFYRSTVAGEVMTERLTAEDSIFYGLLDVQRSHEGYMRFCFVPRDNNDLPDCDHCSSQMTLSRTPRRFKCQPDSLGIGSSHSCDETATNSSQSVWPLFVTRKYGQSGYYQLTLDCPAEISRGAESESEMGAFHDLYHPQRRARLRHRLQEFTPANMRSALIFADEFDLHPGHP